MHVFVCVYYYECLPLYTCVYMVVLSIRVLFLVCVCLHECVGMCAYSDIREGGIFSSPYDYIVLLSKALKPHLLFFSVSGPIESLTHLRLHTV